MSKLTLQCIRVESRFFFAANVTSSATLQLLNKPHNKFNYRVSNRKHNAAISVNIYDFLLTGLGKSEGWWQTVEEMAQGASMGTGGLREKLEPRERII